MRFSPDGKTLASGGDDGSVRLWDIGTETLKATLRHRSPGGFVSVSFSPDGKTLASGNSIERTVVFWDATTGAVKATLVHDHVVYSVSFSPVPQSHCSHVARGTAPCGYGMSPS